MGRLQNKVALITGAARGHAQAIARRFAAEGALLAICDLIPPEELDATTGAQVREAGSRALCFRTDVSDEQQVNEMVARTLAEYGHVDIVAPVVGIAGPTKDLWDLELAEWKQVLAVNLDSIFLCCKAALPSMIERRRGRIIMFSSPTGKQPLAHRSSYATSKMAVIGLTRTLAAEVGRYNITVNAICPGGHSARDHELAKAFAEYVGEPFDDDSYTNYAPGPKPANKVLCGPLAAGRGLPAGPRHLRRCRRHGGVHRLRRGRQLHRPGRQHPRRLRDVVAVRGAMPLAGWLAGWGVKYSCIPKTSMIA